MTTDRDVRRHRHGAAASHAAALGHLITETRRAFHRFGRAAGRLHEDEALAAAERAVLIELRESGPRTVPQMASARPVSRQHIQAIVNSLAARRLVESAPNPRHARSGLVVLTDAGRQLAARVLDKEAGVLARVAARFRVADLEQAAHTLRAVADAIDGPAFLDLLEPTPAAVRRRKNDGRRTPRR